MSNKERQAFQEENRIDYLMVVLSFMTGIQMFNGWVQINSQEATKGDAVVTVPARPTEGLMQ